MNKNRILIVDDDSVSLKFNENYLKDPDWEILSATSGEACIELLLKESVDLIILDVNMPGMDGYETAAQIKIREETADIPFIFLTGELTENFFKGKGYEIGAVDYLSKPVEPRMLRMKVRSLLSISIKQSALRKEIEKFEANRKQLQIESSLSNQQAALLLEIYPSAAAVVNSSGIILDTNGKLELLLNIKKADLFEHLSVQYLHEDSRKEFESVLKHTLENGTSENISCRLSVNGGSSVDISITAAASGDLAILEFISK